MAQEISIRVWNNEECCAKYGDIPPGGELNTKQLTNLIPNTIKLHDIPFSSHSVNHFYRVTYCNE